MRHYDNLNKRTDAGYVVVAVAGLLIVFCGILGLTTDIGMLYFQKGHMQAAADSAAIAAARELERGNTTLIVSGARDDATENGYTDGVSSATVTVNRPPTSGTYNGNSNYIEVIVGRAEPTFFMKALGTSSVNVKARAVAGVDSSDKCMYILNPTGLAVDVSGGLTQLNSPCDIVINSNGVPALKATGGSTINVAVGGIDVYGTYGPGIYNPTPTTGVEPSADPLLYVTAPTAASTCDAAHTNYQAPSGTSSITAGTYCGGITVKSARTLNLGAGTYILKGGGLDVENNNTHLNGTGVTFYNTCNSGSCASSTTGFDVIQIKSGAIAALSAPTSGSLANIVIFVDRNAPVATNVFSGSGTLNLEGSIYAKTQELNFSGGTDYNFLNLNLVIGSLTYSGGSHMNLLHSFVGSGSAIKGAALVE